MTGESQQRYRRLDARWWVVAVCGGVAVLAALAFVLAPVRQPQVTYHWTPAPGPVTPVALPLLPYQPAQLTASFGCDTLRRLGGSRVLLSTVPLTRDPSSPDLPGLRVAVVAGQLIITSYRTPIAVFVVPGAGGCSFTLQSDSHRTRLLHNGSQIATVDGDVRPAVAGLFTEATDPVGLDVWLLTDTRFQTTPTSLKQGLAWLCVAALLGMLLALWRADRLHARVRHRGARRRQLRRPTAVDAMVTAVLVVWLVIGPVTVDDGYIRQIFFSRDSSGFVGNVYRWLNAPEAPFSWFYEVDRGWAALAPGPFVPVLWLRVPSTVLGLVCWLLLSRLVLPRLGRFTAHRRTWWFAAVMFLGWWLPFTPGLRPETWVAAGLTAVLAVTERAIATRRVLLLALGSGLAALTVAMTPAGLVATTPLLAAIVPIFGLLRARVDLHRWPLLVALTAPAASALLLAFADQSVAAVVEAARVRLLIGGGLPWYQEFERYAALLTPTSFIGNLTLRGPVLLSLLAVAGLAWGLFGNVAGRRMPEVSTGPAQRVVLTVTLSLAALTLSPTKWTYQFGALAGPGTALLVLLVQAWSRTGFQAAAARPPGSQRQADWTLVAAIAGLTVVGSLVFAGRNIWPFVSNAGIPWSTARPHLGPVPLAELVLGTGSLIVAALTVRIARSGADRPHEPGGRWARCVPSPGLLALLLIAAMVVINLGSFAQASIVERHRYTLADEDLAALRGPSCGLVDDLSVEVDPAAGLLQPLAGEAESTRPSTDLPLLIAGQALPGWQVPGSTGMSTGWYRLTPDQLSGAAPVVLTVVGPPAPQGALTAEFGRPGSRGDMSAGATALADPGGDGVRDIRALAPPGATAVRLLVAASSPPLAVSVPRSPRTVPMNTVLAPGSTALLDWPVAFVFPCLRIPALRNGTAEVPPWRVAPPSVDTSAHITYSPRFGGPFAGPAMLVHQQRLPVYLRNAPTREVVSLYRWTPITRFTTLQPEITTQVVASWKHDGHVNVPGLDEPP